MSASICVTNTDLCVTSETPQNTCLNASTAIRPVCVTEGWGCVKGVPSCASAMRAQHEAARAQRREATHERGSASAGGRR
jgi:hypothetical protein